jgi:hypothetical protein
VLDFNTPRTRTPTLDLGNVGAQLRWLSGHPYFVTADDRFAYAFACFACSGLPLRIFRYEDGRFLDVTRRFPGLVAEDARSWWQLTVDPHGSDRLGFAAAWAADEALLGRAGPAHAALERLAAQHKLDGYDERGRRRSGRRYVATLWRFLAEMGYLPRGQ